MRSIQFVRPCSKEREPLAARFDWLESLGHRVLRPGPLTATSWPYTADSQAKRSQELNQALLADVDTIWSSRGGYGASDLLDDLPWQELAKRNRGPILVGFSDVCAIQSAL